MEALLVSLSLRWSRLAVIVGLTPFFGSTQLPRLFRVAVAVSLTVLWWDTPTGGLGPTLTLLQQASSNAWLWGLLVAREVLIGLVLALAMRLLLVPARVAGEFIAQEMLLSFAAATHPGSDTPGTLLGQWFELAVLVLFFSMDGHHLLLAVIHAAWINWPIGELSLWPGCDWQSGCRLVLHSGVQLALPVTACLFLLGVGLALLARAAPPLNLFSLGFVVRVLGGLVALYVFWPVLLVGLVQTLQNVSRWLAHYGG